MPTPTLDAIVLGTAAAEGIPALYCGCAACRYAREAGGKEVRARQSLFLPPDIVIDLGPDAMHAVHRFGLDWTGLAAVLYTHSHEDHCQPENLLFLHYPFAHNRTVDTLTLHGNAHVRAAIDHMGREIPGTEFREVKVFEPFALPNAEGVAIPSHHKNDGEETLNFIITRHGKRLLYALDTGHYDEETWEFLAAQRLDAAIFECTYGMVTATYHGHLGLPEVVAMRERLVQQGTLAADAPSYITHFSHNGVRPHAEMEALAAAHGLSVAYDGLKLAI